MNTDDLETRLRELDPRRPSAGFAGRVLAQRPDEPLSLIPWWRRRVAIPLPALAAALVLFILIQVILWHHARPRPGATADRLDNVPASIQTPKPDTRRPTVTMASASNLSQTEIMVTMSGDCAFHLNQ